MSDEETTKAINRIRNAGSWFLGIGWFVQGLFVLVFSALALIAEERNALIISIPLLPIMCLIPYAYIRTGKYVKYMQGRLISLFLILDLISCIFWLGGWIGIFLTVVALTSYRKLNSSKVIITLEENDNYKAKLTKEDRVAFFGSIVFCELVLLTSLIFRF